MSDIKNYDKYKHLIGTKVNEWTILDIICDPNKTNTYLSVQCSCGTIAEMSITTIIKNYKLDCGCVYKKKLYNDIINKYKYLINTQINDWTVLDIIPPNKDHKTTHLLCECKCGTTKTVNISNLLSGKSKNCGCGRKEYLKNKAKNLVGQRFGKLIAIERLEKRNKYGRIMYKCKCDCGNEVDVIGYCLTSKHTNSCGCITSYYNMYIEQLLKKKEIDFQSEYTVYIQDKYYRFDFYLPQYNLFIEYDGEQHYNPVKFYNCDEEELEHRLKTTQEHDKIKNKYCEDNNINLLRIPYWESKNIETIINNHLQRLTRKGLY